LGLRRSKSKCIQWQQRCKASAPHAPQNESLILFARSLHLRQLESATNHLRKCLSEAAASQQSSALNCITLFWVAW
jgi:hypothetical protein